MFSGFISADVRRASFLKRNTLPSWHDGFFPHVYPFIVTEEIEGGWMALYAAAAATTATALDPLRCHSAKRWRVSMQFFSGNDREGESSCACHCVAFRGRESLARGRTDGSSYNILSSNLPNSISRRQRIDLPTGPAQGLIVPAADNLNEPKLTPPLEHGSINTFSIC